MTSFAERCAAIELLVLDVDGVLTDGRIVYSDRGDEIKAFHVRDGSGIKMWLKMGKRVALLSGRSSPAVERRARELGVSVVIQGAENKLPAFERLLSEQGVSAAQTACIGDDLPDVPLLIRCGAAIAVADACAEAKAAAHYVTRTPGGRGAVRDAIETMLRHQGVWQDVVTQYQR